MTSRASTGCGGTIREKTPVNNLYFDNALGLEYLLPPFDHLLVLKPETLAFVIFVVHRQVLLRVKIPPHPIRNGEYLLRRLVGLRLALVFLGYRPCDDPPGDIGRGT